MGQPDRNLRVVNDAAVRREIKALTVRGEPDLVRDAERVLTERPAVDERLRLGLTVAYVEADGTVVGAVIGFIHSSTVIDLAYSVVEGRNVVDRRVQAVLRSDARLPGTWTLASVERQRA